MAGWGLEKFGIRKFFTSFWFSCLCRPLRRWASLDWHRACCRKRVAAAYLATRMRFRWALHDWHHECWRKWIPSVYPAAWMSIRRCHPMNKLPRISANRSQFRLPFYIASGIHLWPIPHLLLCREHKRPNHNVTTSVVRNRRFSDCLQVCCYHGHRPLSD